MRGTQLLRRNGTILASTARTRPSRILPISIRTQQQCRNAVTAIEYAAPGIRRGLDKEIPPSPYQHLPSPPPEACRKSARLAALHARLYLSPRIPLETLGRCLIDSTADPHPSFNNTSLALLGNDILGYHTSELILCRYPRLPSKIVLASMTAYIGPAALTDLARSWGVEAAAVPGGEVDAGLLQFTHVKPGNSEALAGTGVLEKERTTQEGRITKRYWQSGRTFPMTRDDFFGAITGQEVLTPVQQSSGSSSVSSSEASSSLSTSESVETLPAGTGSTYQGACTNFIRAVLGAVYIHAGRAAAKNFFAAHIASRKLDVSKLFVFKSPERDLAKLCAREGFEPPIARMISETGRHSIAPTYNVGVFSGREKLGEGTGASLSEARFRAAVSALKGWYLYSPGEIAVPSDVEGGATATGKEWTPVLIDAGEVVW